MADKSFRGPLSLPVGIELHHCGCSFLERAAGDVKQRPIEFCAQAPGKCDLAPMLNSRFCRTWISRLDYYDGFKTKCDILDDPKVKDKSINGLPPCAQKNLQICVAATQWRKAPLGWMLSQGASLPLDLSATSAAKRLIAAAGLTVIDDAE